MAEYITRCIQFQQVKAEHRNPTSLLQALPILDRKWEIISLDFITSIPKNQNQNDFMMVVVDKLSKGTHFIHVITTYKAINIADIFMKEIFCLYGIPKMIICDKDPKFTGNFWKSLFKILDTKLNFSTAYHLQTEGKT